ncbi:transcriptional regulator, LacI family domain protein (plasmid) [Agrobacterium sp. RAC06]|nr:transcriptional regulator, LacI family domain protein [Agrobacterium sp. RAC06]
MPILAAAGNVEFSQIAVAVHERTPFGEQALRDDRIDTVIAQDPGHAVRSAMRIMRARSDARQPLAAQEKIRIQTLLKENL